MKKTRTAVFGAFVCVLLFAISANADIIPILSQGTAADSDEFNNGNSLTPSLGTGANVVLTGYPPVWQTPPAGSSWVSYADTGAGGPADNTVVRFTQKFYLPYSTNTGSIMVWADDTTRVSLDGNLKFPENMSQGTNCANGQIGCIPANGGQIVLTGISSGTHTLWFDTFQNFGDGFGLLYAGSIESVPDGGATLALLGGALLGLGVLRRRFWA